MLEGSATGEPDSNAPEEQGNATPRVDRRPGWIAASALALTTSIMFGFLFFRQIALGEAPFLVWALAVSGWFPVAAIIAFWTLARARNAQLPPVGARIALTAIMFLGTGACLMYAFWVFAEGNGGFR